MSRSDDRAARFARFQTVEVPRLRLVGMGFNAAGVLLQIGVFANTLTKLVIALAIGRGKFRLWTATGLALMATALAAAIVYAARV